MELIKIPAANLKHLEHNARKLKHAKGIEKLAEQIRIHGFQSPLNVWLDPDDGKYAIIAGNHRFKAGYETGMREFPCVVYVGTRDQAYARSISDNKTSELTTWDFAEFNLAIIALDLNSADCGFEKIKFDDIAKFNEKLAIKEKIEQEKEYHYAQIDFDKMLAAYSRKLMSIWQDDPENMNRAALVILPTDSGNKGIMILSDPSTTDIISELKRYAEQNDRSPLEKLTAAIINYKNLISDPSEQSDPSEESSQEPQQ